MQTVVETWATDTNRFLLARVDASPIAAPLTETRGGLSESLALVRWGIQVKQMRRLHLAREMRVCQMVHSPDQVVFLQTCLLTASV